MLNADQGVEPAGLRAVEHLLEQGHCATVDYRLETASTNTSALAALRAGEIPAQGMPKIYLADAQTGGRGRHGRRWVSDDGTLTFSLVFDRSDAGRESMKLFSLAVGVGVARGIEFECAPLQTKLKWPNDVQIAGGKVAGILLETTQQAELSVVAGVGINVTRAPNLGEDSAAGPVQSISEVIGRQVQRYDLLPAVVEGVVGAIDDLDRCAKDMVEEFRSRCVLTGHTVRGQHGESSFEGHCKGITDEGDLIVETDHGIRHLHSGEANRIRTQEH